MLRDAGKREILLEKEKRREINGSGCDMSSVTKCWPAMCVNMYLALPMGPSVCLYADNACRNVHECVYELSMDLVAPTVALLGHLRKRFSNSSPSDIRTFSFT